MSGHSGNPIVGRGRTPENSLKISNNRIEATPTWGTINLALISEDAIKNYPKTLAEANKTKKMNESLRQEAVEDWKNQIRNKLIEIFHSKSASENLLRVLYHLGEKDKAYSNSPEAAPAWRTLRSALDSGHVFKVYSNKLIESTKEGERDQTFRSTMKEVLLELPACNQELPDSSTNISSTCGRTEVLEAWSLMTPEVRQQILDVLPCIVANDHCRIADDGTSLAVGAENIAKVGLAMLVLGINAKETLMRWWNEEISSQDCFEFFVDSASCLSTGVGGVVAASMLGSRGGTLGALFGGIVGGFALYMHKKERAPEKERACNKDTLRIFETPKSRALADAYAYFGVTEHSSNVEINSAFRKMCLKHHPDKGGTVDKFLEVQLKLAVIKMARGESP